MVVREVKGGAFAVSKAYKPQLLFFLGVLRRFGLIETPYWGLMVLYILRQNVHNRPAGANGRSYHIRASALV